MALDPPQAIARAKQKRRTAATALPLLAATDEEVPRAAFVRRRGLVVYDDASGPADRGDALAASGGSANAIAFPSGSGTFTWRTPFE